MTSAPANDAGKEPSAPEAGSLSRAGDLFQLLRDGQARTRAELALTTGLARSTVASRIDALISSGLVGPAGEASSSGGRPPSRFAFNPAARVVLAVDVGATHVIVAVTDLGGKILAEQRLKQDVSDGPDIVLGRVIAAGKELLAEAGREMGDLAGMGIGLPGPVEHDTGRPVKPPIMPGWDGFDVVPYVQRSLPVPVLVDNDVNIMALGERTAYWPEHENFLFIKVATGIGAGIISSGELQRGANGTAGDLGHVRVPRGDEVLCRCGNYGCLEALASGPAVARQLHELGLEASTGADVLRLVGEGNLQAIQALRQAGRDVGDVLATVVNLLNPSMIVIGGSVGEAGEHLVAGIREVVYRRSLPLATTHLRIGISMAGDRAAILGASQMVTQYVLSPAVIEATLQATG
ncbi:ROK family transcriptional regulator [Arthrobacter sp. TES]|uniref:ROK family transcriptional regulator n=1 Tax=Paenarthrobacter ureafaciens TaxID=37931 RepID=UPI0003971592|nr:ROK family transcriptional regulator [Paenarthrobacter ureafaciens]AOY72790.1 ROK family transcriptional regulator [Arthrobacter sp. ZXY-2]QOI64412.1 ROK family transcriptional regulator [Arthrobacter sp. TES]MBN9128991.1 ROK family transcriptional regulator [Paenarthrobacter ureafaciens]GLU59005.1 sugar kinase [Paenarthrobacter ureafaciens]GLU63272.1 sugar kinase [Paenarthrobacter ureafaciens]